VRQIVELDAVLGEHVGVLAEAEPVEPWRDVVRHPATPPRRAFKAKFYASSLGMSIDAKCSVSSVNWINPLRPLMSLLVG
jgi:hypothetical protein